jgi:hypothetical protein
VALGFNLTHADRFHTTEFAPEAATVIADTGGAQTRLGQLDDFLLQLRLSRFVFPDKLNIKLLVVFADSDVKGASKAAERHADLNLSIVQRL